MKNTKGRVFFTIPHNKNTNDPKEVCKSHEKYETWILYFSCKYEYNVSSKHFKQASQTDKHKGSSQTKKITINAAIILRLNSTQQ